MQTQILTKNLRLLERQETRITEKCSRLERHLGMLGSMNSSELRIELHREAHNAKEKFICDLTLFLPSKVSLRAEHHANSPEAAFDLAINKLDRQVRKLRTKRNIRSNHYSPQLKAQAVWT